MKVWTATYTPFGGVHTSTGALPSARFPGQWFQSESGLHQNWMRDYDPTTGRYLQADPLGLVDGASVYGYAAQSPMMSSDPTGLCSALPLAVCPIIPPVGDPNWEPYYGDPYWFHCGFDGYLEKRSPTPENPIAECFYDNGRLVDGNHPYPSCGGTPDQYGKDSPFSHTFRDSGGIMSEGWGAFHESQRYFSDQERLMCDCEPDVTMPWGY
ncbi:MAG: RHS repeat-associated core domain-containing protein [Rhodobacterales bacterium]|nr:RHS repeat-associated core domain-containing protein [Rhodobacterales bacterium]